MYYCSCLLFFSFFMVFSNVDSASVHKRGLQLPTNINLDLKLGKGSAAKNAEAPPPTDGSHKTVINAPFGLASLTITTSNNNKKPSSSSSSSSAIKEPGKPCNTDSEYIETNDNKKPLNIGGSSGTLGGQGGAFFGPPHMRPHSEFGPPPPPPHDYHHHPHPDSHYPPPPSSHHFHHHPPPPPPHHSHHHHPDCHHGEGEFFPSFTSSTEIPFVPEVKPDPKITTVAPPKEKIPEVTSAASSTTQNVDLLIDEIFSGSNSNSAGSTTTTRSNIDANNAEQTGEGVLDIRMPTPAPSKPKRSRS
ncbi:homeobox protein OTX1-like isoform X2 [Planococcus citri]